jgi:hypothetical protein
VPKLNLNEFAQEPVLIEDRYPATLKEVTEYERDYGEGPVPKIAWVFEVEAPDSAIDPDVEHDGEPTGTYEIAAHTSFATGPKSTFGRLGLRAWAGDDWSGETDDLLGNEAIVDVTSYSTKGGQTRNVIERVRVPKGGKAKVASGVKRTAQEEEDIEFSDIPF